MKGILYIMKLKKFIKSGFISVISAVSVINMSNLCSSVYAEDFISDTITPEHFFSIVQNEPQEVIEQYEGLKGDLNYDGILNADDIIQMKKILSAQNQDCIQADINDDGKIDTYDFVLLKNIILNPEPQQEKKIICLDAGHYGLYNPSPGVKGYYESNMSWKLHLYLKEELESYGFEVVTTRENQATDCALVSRGQTSAGCNLFLSLHSNAVGSYMNESTDFPVAIVLLPDDNTDIDEISAEIGKRLTNAVADTMGTRQAGSIWTRRSDNDRNGDGELNDEWYGVLFGAKSVGTPAILMEHSFHTNTRSAKWLLDDGNLRNLAAAEAKVIAEYFGLA